MEKLDLGIVVKSIKDFKLEEIMFKKDVNKSFNNTFEDIKAIFGFSPDCLGNSWINDKDIKK